jgi:MFS family permease
MTLEFQLKLGTSPTGAAWIVSAFLLSGAVAIPILGRLGDIYGKKKLLLVSLGSLVVGSLISALSASLAPMLAGRTIQGVGAAVLPLSWGIIRDEFPANRIPQGVALMSAIVGAASGAGVALAGPISGRLSYHWLFWIPLVVVAVVMVATVFFIPESPVRARARVDVVGAILLSGWLVALLVGVSQGNVWGWSSRAVIFLFATASIVLVVWIWFELRTPSPLVDMGVCGYEASGRPTR